MFERDGCAWCKRWNKEIGAIYERTQEAQRLPLRRVNLDRQEAQITLREPVRYSPTFVAVDDGGTEVGRITGYINDDSFWGLLGVLLGKLPPEQPPQRTSDRVTIKAAVASE
jgi:thioredoxin-related protein